MEWFGMEEIGFGLPGLEEAGYGLTGLAWIAEVGLGMNRLSWPGKTKKKLREKSKRKKVKNQFFCKIQEKLRNTACDEYSASVDRM
jgi:hypothetical protein